jgi:hypothetical protein
MKTDLHNKLKNVKDTVTITVDEFISVYGNDNTRKQRGVTLSRADILAKVYNLSVEKQDNNYVFTSHKYY